MKECPYCGADMQDDDKPIIAHRVKPQVNTGKIKTSKKKRKPSTMSNDKNWQSKRAEIMMRDDYTCMRCDSKKHADKLTVHHIKPRSKGGGDYSANLVTLCPRCHDFVEVGRLYSIADIIGSFPGETFETDTGSNIRSKYEDVRYRPAWSIPEEARPRKSKPDFSRWYGSIYTISQMVVQGYRFKGVELSGTVFGITIDKRP